MFKVHDLLLMPPELSNACLYTVMTNSDGISGYTGQSFSITSCNYVKFSCCQLYNTAHCMLNGSVVLAVFIYFHFQLLKAAAGNQ